MNDKLALKGKKERKTWREKGETERSFHPLQNEVHRWLELPVASSLSFRCSLAPVAQCEAAANWSGSRWIFYRQTRKTATTLERKRERGRQTESEADGHRERERYRYRPHLSYIPLALITPLGLTDIRQQSSAPPHPTPPRANQNGDS